MFTPPKKIFSCWSLRTDPTRKSGSGGGDVSKGKDVVFDDDGLMGRVENTGANMGLKAKLMKLETEVAKCVEIGLPELIILVVFSQIIILFDVVENMSLMLKKLRKANPDLNFDIGPLSATPTSGQDDNNTPTTQGDTEF
ncbi:hypothetical protein POM88_000329 [Heracleum sosnowskyi]|uniref:Uncharacterized protein n=1 Tax=Heracleum sosnowskyi TaxID=360622 RepID=A0AAD8JC37_9APIA|nr:hypothetical protein POM88_000329 [Heracleum sosnowskyi]